ncbi:papilin [Lingula anatina]|uniref:Papilin n=1 Tax=Lingula anatina TaxID=7574 RepID=A0A1S3JU57_LINAN|nr:papilin [Lingula anatina]|eukprot:XP_013413858.1 papilin [Lingula anatina]
MDMPAAVVVFSMFCLVGLATAQQVGGPCLSNNPCGPGTRCVQDTIFCVRAPCPQPAPRCVPDGLGQTSNQVCTLGKDVGPCRAKLDRFHYNANAGRCEQFDYGGCRGNGNNFRSRAECENTCMVPRIGGQTRVQTTDPLPPRNPLQRPRRPPGPSQVCPDGLVFSNCGLTCTRTCSNPSPRCVTTCKPGCMCPMERPFFENGRCVTRNECRLLATRVGLPVRNPNVPCRFDSFSGRLVC